MLQLWERLSQSSWNAYSISFEQVLYFSHTKEEKKAMTALERTRILEMVDLSLDSEEVRSSTEKTLQAEGT